MVNYRSGQRLRAEDLNAISQATQLIEAQQLDSSGTFTFPSDGTLTQEFTYLELFLDGQITEGDGFKDVWLQFNGNTGNNYTWYRYGFNSSGTTPNGSNADGTHLTFARWATQWRNSAHAIISNYTGGGTSAVAVQATSFANNANAAGSMELCQAGGFYTVTEVVTSIHINVFGQTFKAGTKASLYGRR